MIYIGLGSNLKGSYGTPDETCLKAVKILQRYGIRIITFSGLWHTYAIPFNSGPIYSNAVIMCKNNNKKMKAIQLLRILKLIEIKMGRKHGKRLNKPRVIDLDLLDYNGVISKNNPILPHPRMHLRKFVLEPLFKINPNWKHPLTGLKAKEMLIKINSYQKVLKI